MKKIISIIMCVFIMSSFAGCGSYSDGFDDGYEEGYDAGFDDGTTNASFENIFDDDYSDAVFKIEDALQDFRKATGMYPEEAFDIVESFLDGECDYTEYEVNLLIIALSNYCINVERIVDTVY